MKCWNGERRMYLVNVKLHSFTYINVHIISLSLFLHLFPSYARRPCGPSREAESRRANVRKSEGNALKRNIKEAAATEDDLARRAWPRRWRRPSLASRSCLVPPGGGVVLYDPCGKTAGLWPWGRADQVAPGLSRRVNFDLEQGCLTHYPSWANFPNYHLEGQPIFIPGFPRLRY